MPFDTRYLELDMEPRQGVNSAVRSGYVSSDLTSSVCDENPPPTIGAPEEYKWKMSGENRTSKDKEDVEAVDSVKWKTCTGCCRPEKCTRENHWTDGMITERWASLIHSNQMADNLTHSSQIADNLTHSNQITDSLNHSNQTTDSLIHSNHISDNLAHSNQISDNLTHSNQMPDTLTHSNQMPDNLTHSNQMPDNLTHSNQLTDNHSSIIQMTSHRIPENQLTCNLTSKNQTSDTPSPLHYPCDDTPLEPPTSDQKTKMSSPPRTKKVILILLLIAFFSAGCGFSLPAPFFPQEAESKGVSNTVIGLIFSTYEFMIFLSSPLYGNYLMKIGPKFMLVSGTFVAGTCSILFGLLDMCPKGASFVTLCFACRSIEALAISAILTSGFTIISKEFPHNVATSFAVLEMSDGAGLMVGPAVGGVLFQIGGYGLPFFVIGSLNLFVGTIVYFLLPDPQGMKDERKGSIVSMLKHPMVWFTGASIIVCAVGVSFLDPTLAKQLEQFNLSTSLIGLMFVITPCLYAVTSPVWGRISDSMNINGTLITLGNLMCGLGLLVVGPSPFLPFLPVELWVIILGLVILGFFYALAIVPTMNCLLISAIELGFENNLETYGIVVGLFNAIYYLGTFIGPMLGGVLIEELGFRAGATVISEIYFVVMISCGLYFVYRHLRSKPNKNSSCVDYGATRPETQTIVPLRIN
ncbi:MFS-type transporter SLC18B1-like [Physella acuta]|uniref:MFS-type transporter SLC18B1-like n=1 Tax=Physella acuta TaxID=109671 RepID=UPI0027DE9B45|nr:MFS-type transporter SLC18B1-like [Physella acuta]